MSARLLHIAYAERTNSTRWHQLEPMHWDEVLAWLDLDSPADHKECGGYVGGLLRNETRKREHVMARSLLTLDADKPEPTFLADVERVLSGVAVAVHTTWRHGPERSRYRLLAPLSRDVSAPEYERLATSVRDALGQHWGPDKGCPEPERFMYRPSAQNGSYAAKVLPGTPLDVERWLGRPTHLYAAAAVAAELTRLDGCEVLGWAGPGWNNTCYEVACNLIEFANSPWAGYSLDQAEAAYLAHAPTDNRFGPREHEGCWDSARKTVGSRGRPDPDTTPADDFTPEQGTVDVTDPAAALMWLRDEMGRGALSGLFRRSGRIVHTPRIGEQGYVAPRDGTDDDGPAQVRGVQPVELATRVDFAYEVTQLRGSGRRLVSEPALFPREPAARLLSVPDLLPHVRELRSVTHTPTVLADGSVLDVPGYAPGAGLLYLPDAGLSVPKVSEHPTRAEVVTAGELLSRMVEGFPFVTPHDRANYLGALLTPLLREVVPPPYKLVAIGAPQRGSGKSLLALLLRTIHGGVFRAEFPANEEEVRKVITATLYGTTGAVVQFDNVTGTLKSGTLDGVLTTVQDQDRLFGKNSEVLDLRNDRLWVVTGNNVRIGGDLVRRTLWVTIDANMERPEERTDFAIADLAGWVAAHRGEVLHALLTLIRAWVVAGRPVGEVPTSDQFGQWIQALRGILAFADLGDGVVGHRDSVRTEADPEEAEWADFLAAVWRWRGSEPWTTKELIEAVNAATHFDSEALREEHLPGDIALLTGRPDRASRSLGMWLAHRRDKWAGGHAIRSAGEHEHARRWRVE